METKAEVLPITDLTFACEMFAQILHKSAAVQVRGTTKAGHSSFE